MLFEILNCFRKEGYIFFEEPNTTVTSVAQHSPNLSGTVVMVDEKFVHPSTNLTHFLKCIVLFLSDLVDVLQLVS